ncbi:MAG: archaellin/type IV pilin N-terminal domain-containing protein [Candidatus Pacearchaeota archaeon]
MNKKGLSTIVATLLIVLIAIAAVLVVWAVVNNMLKGQSEHLVKADCLNIVIDLKSCSKTNKNAIIEYTGGNVGVAMVSFLNSTASENKEISNLQIGFNTVTTTITDPTQAALTVYLDKDKKMVCGTIETISCT